MSLAPHSKAWILVKANVANPIYYSDRFVARVKAAKLKGINFTKVWSSED